MQVGEKLGAYEVIAKLGEGGMGEVYRALDSKLGREVALKILPEAFAADPDRLMRFEREARTLASLNHPHIAQVYGIEDSGARRALVMELIAGEDLSARIARGPIPLDEALPIARQIADALEAAHEAGIIHRDLKPANVKVRPDGTVKVLDFGLAKGIEQGAGTRDQGSGSLANSPTITSPALTMRGVVLGTAAYMAPEQAKGKFVDRRADIWAFGCVLYEMLTGVRPFKGEDISDIMAAILRDEPAMDALPSTTPPFVRLLLERCLQKDPNKRLPHIGLVRLEFDTPRASLIPQSIPTATRRSRLWSILVPVATAVVAAGAVAASMWQPVQPPAPLTRFSFALPEGHTFTSNNRKMIDISPDGRRIVYIANRQLYLRDLGEPDPQPIKGTNLQAGTLNPVFSPDGAWIVFEGGGTLMRVPVEGGTVQTVCICGATFGLNWDDTGILTATRAGIIRVQPQGGDPDVLVPPRPNEMFYGPRFLPGKRQLLYTVADSAIQGGTPDPATARLVVQGIGEADAKPIAKGFDGRYLSTGHILYRTGAAFLVAPFDLQTLIVGEASAAVANVAVATGQLPFASHLAVSASGTLAYVPGGGGAEQDLAVLDRTGRVTSMLQLPRAAYATPRVSPDGSHVAYSGQGSNASIFIASLAGASAPRRLTFEGRNFFPVWSPDGRRIAFQSDRDRDLAIYWQPVDGSGAVERLTRPETDTVDAPEAFSPDGERLLFRRTKGALSELWVWSRADRAVQRLTAAAGVLPNASFSPDGRWMAYVATDRRPVTFVEPFPPTGARYELPIPERGADMAIHPVWGRNRKEIVYSVGPGLLATTTVTAGRTVEFGAPSLIQIPGAGNAGVRSWDLTPDGTSIVRVVETIGGLALQPPIHVVMNWSQQIEQRDRPR